MVMPERGADIAYVGYRVHRRVLLALALSAVLPLLVLVYVIQAFVIPVVGPDDGIRFWALHFLLFSTGLAMLAGGYVIWDVGRMVARMARMMAQEGAVAKVERRNDEVGTLMHSFAKMLGTIEQQASEINGFAARLDSAYKELEAANTRLKDASFKDEVTGLYNRRFFSLRLEEEISRYRRFNHPVSVVLLDLDGFKAVNDDMGHQVGDTTLRDVGQILMRHSRGINVVARFGGDEFVVLLVETSKTGARLYADRIRQILSAHAFPHGKPITASFGISSLPDDEASTSEELIKLADEALYVAKRAGKNQVGSMPISARIS
jgi:diguanylate cyclase (GGDEF)-like protein